MGETDGATLTTVGDTRRSRSEKTAPYLFLVLECDRPKAMPARCALDRVDSVVLGRGPERSLRIGGDGKLRVLSIELADRRLSSAHARFERALGRWMIIDADSKNGTFVNGERVTAKELADGDWIELGHALFRFRSALPATDSDAIVEGSALQSTPPGLATLLPGLENTFNRMRQIASSSVPIVIGGETGTGKELVARAVHTLSARRGRFVAVNCGAIPNDLVESELFGHKRGAFSGAVEDRLGHVRTADGGTLFLDEIGDLPPPGQAALLRVLQESEVVPVGATDPIEIDLRVVAAAHRDLESLVADGGFREDLLARLSGYLIELPPVRERREDLGLLVAALLTRMAPDTSVTLSREAARAIVDYDWPRNIRQLEQTLSAALALAGDGRIDLEHLPPALQARPEPTAPPELSPDDEALRNAIEAALREHRGNISAAARDLGKARQQVQRWVKRFQLDLKAFE